MTPTSSYALLDEDDVFGGDGGDDAFICLETLEPLAGLAVKTDYKCNRTFVSGVANTCRQCRNAKGATSLPCVPRVYGPPTVLDSFNLRSGSSFTFQSSFFKGFVSLHF